MVAHNTALHDKCRVAASGTMIHPALPHLHHQLHALFPEEGQQGVVQVDALRTAQGSRALMMADGQWSVLWMT